MIKRILASFLVGILALSASAEFRWGPTAGVNFSNFYFKQKLIDTSMSAGPQAGILGEMMFPGIGFGVDFGLRYQMHGAKVNLGQKEVWAADGFGNEQIWLHTIQIPVNLRYKYTNLAGTEDYIAPFAYAGPVFSFTVAHSKCAAMEYPGGSFGLQVGLGAELWRKFQVSAGYYWGMSYEMRTLKLDNFSARNRHWTVNLTYLF